MGGAAESGGSSGPAPQAPRRKAVRKEVVVAVRLTHKEAALVDARRGHLTRSEWLRWLLTRQR
jgi:hypothetical protein